MFANNTLTGTVRYMSDTANKRFYLLPLRGTFVSCWSKIKWRFKKNLSGLFLDILCFLTQITANNERETKEADNLITTTKLIQI